MGAGRGGWPLLICSLAILSLVRYMFRCDSPFANSDSPTDPPTDRPFPFLHVDCRLGSYGVVPSPSAPDNDGRHLSSVSLLSSRGSPPAGDPPPLPEASTP
jgi:hypothetical protein